MGSIPGSPGAAEIARLQHQGGYGPGLAWMESLVPSENKQPPSDHFSRGLQLCHTPVFMFAKIFAILSLKGHL